MPASEFFAKGFRKPLGRCLKASFAAGFAAHFVLGDLPPASLPCRAAGTPIRLFCAPPVRLDVYKRQPLSARPAAARRRWSAWRPGFTTPLRAKMCIRDSPNTVKDPAALRASWNAAYGGSGNASRVAVLEEGILSPRSWRPPRPLA